jgi:hypothetical protein
VKRQRLTGTRTARWFRGSIVVVAVGAIGVGVLGAPTAGAATKDAKDHKPAALSRTSPAVVVAEQSRAEVAELHDLALSAGQAGRHSGAIPASAEGLETSLRSEQAAIKALHPKASSADGVLERSLTNYLGLATRLANSTTASTKPLPSSYFNNLRSTDSRWRKALMSLGKSSHQNLLAGMPPLLFPKRSA